MSPTEKKNQPNINQQTKSLSHQYKKEKRRGEKKKRAQYITAIAKHKTSYKSKFWLCKTASIQASIRGGEETIRRKEILVLS